MTYNLNVNLERPSPPPYECNLRFEDVQHELAPVEKNLEMEFFRPPVRTIYDDGMERSRKIHEYESNLVALQNALFKMGKNRTIECEVRELKRKLRILKNGIEMKEDGEDKL